QRSVAAQYHDQVALGRDLRLVKPLFLFSDNRGRLQIQNHLDVANGKPFCELVYYCGNRAQFGLGDDADSLDGCFHRGHFSRQEDEMKDKGKRLDGEGKRWRMEDRESRIDVLAILNLRFSVLHNL